MSIFFKGKKGKTAANTPVENLREFLDRRVPGLSNNVFFSTQDEGVMSSYYTRKGSVEVEYRERDNGRDELNIKGFDFEMHVKVKNIRAFRTYYGGFEIKTVDNAVIRVNDE